MSLTMSAEERQHFLAEVHVGVVAVERLGRAPLAVPIWYGYRPGGEVVLWTSTDSVKGRLIREAGRFTLTAQTEDWPYRYVSAEGPVVAFDEPASPEVVREIAIRYLGPEEGAKFTDENYQAEGSVVIRMRPERWLSTDYTKA
ncbi:pyridoxamine 5'-phosphate oxidase family protein [Amycolatopsis magusensis]|uniref:pyridoxamine 5'-phosphate oxidase family protein n=1 Tax=Amycolatopsis magusensis TaxID=882444 RepID=UPI0024A9B64B|nr:pyridoxamine 5'-phosphate oxidase family protein [Amycolatopsis magusensis]MDI5981748.1 pyridoxamine 5'-phosphate oxidase family protein [Amycolatopsis magusensis]